MKGQPGMRQARPKAVTSARHDEHWTYETAGSFLGVSRSRLEALVRAGEIRRVKLGPRSVRFSRAELERFVERRSRA